MLTNKRHFLAMLATILICFGLPALAQPHWTSLTHAAPAHLDTCLLLTDGSVMCHEYNSNRWHRLSPDINGSYVNGAWDSPAISHMPNGTDTACPSGCQYRPLYFGSAVLDSGKVVVVGGEYNNLNPVWTNIGFMYNPNNDNWSSQLTVPFPTGTVGDAQTAVLRNGTLLLAQITTGNIASFDPSTNTFTALNPTGKVNSNDEEGWTLLPNGRVLAVNAGTPNLFQIYNPNTNQWGGNGNTAGVALTDIGTGACSPAPKKSALPSPDQMARLSILAATRAVRTLSSISLLEPGHILRTWIFPSYLALNILLLMRPLRCSRTEMFSFKAAQAVSIHLAISSNGTAAP